MKVQRITAGTMWVCSISCSIFSLGCDRHLRATMRMTWECAPQMREAGYPEAEPVMFHYVEYPNSYVLASGRGLCRSLTMQAQQPVDVEFQIRGNRWNGLRGYDIESVGGRKIENAGGPGWSGSQGNSPQPFTHLFR